MIASTPLKAQRCVLSVWRPQRVVASKPFTPGQSLTYVQSVCSPATHTHTLRKWTALNSGHRTLRTTEYNGCVCEPAPYKHQLPSNLRQQQTVPKRCHEELPTRCTRGTMRVARTSPRWAFCCL